MSSKLFTGLALLALASAAPLRPQAPEPSWTTTGELNTGRSGHTATLLPDGRVLVAGGVDAGNSMLGGAELFDPVAGTWSVTGSLTARRAYHTAILLPNGKVLVVGGLSAPNINASVDTVELYDPATGAWTSNGAVHNRGDATATLLQSGKVLVVGSHTSDPVASSSAELYDPATGTSTPTGSLSAGRSLHAATLLPSGKLLVTGGHVHPIEAGVAAAEVYDPETGTWSRGGNLATGRFEHTAILLADGKVLVLGGWVQGFTRTNTAELYDPDSGVWTVTGAASATGGSAALLPDGKVLLVGAAGAELYDPRTGTWSGTAAPRGGTGTATLLPSGKVLLAGGRGAARRAELYDPGPLGARTYLIPDRGGVSLRTAGSSAPAVVGYARLQPHPDSAAPFGVAIFSLRQGGVLVSEAGVPASPAIRAGRIYAEAGGTANTGVAIANPNDESANVDFYFTDSSGGDARAGRFSIPAHGQLASFLDQSPFSGVSSLGGTVTLDSSLPVGVVGLRGSTNERSEFLMTTLPVAELAASILDETAILPHFADGGGWTTQIVLVNPTDEPMNGTLLFMDPGSAAARAQPVAVTVAGQTSSLFQYTLPRRGARRFLTSGTGAAASVGSVRITPAGGHKTPSAVAVFSFRKAGVTVSEAGVPAIRPASAFRFFAESSASVKTGIAVANASTDPATIRLDVTDLAGRATGSSGTAFLAGGGSVSMFLDQIEGLEGLPDGFEGIVRASVPAPARVSLIALRGHVNERNDFLITTLPAAPEGATMSTRELLFAHFVDGGGYTTQFILSSGSPGRLASGWMRFVGQLGERVSPIP